MWSIRDTIQVTVLLILIVFNMVTILFVNHSPNQTVICVAVIGMCLLALYLKLQYGEIENERDVEENV